MCEKNTRITTNSNWRIATNAKRIAKKLFVVICVILFVAIRGAGAAHAASLSFSPSSGSYKIGDTFSLNILVSSAGQAMNAVSGIISFPKDKLQATSVSKSGSIINLWVQEPSFSNSAGTIDFEGIVLNPGFAGSAGKILAISFKAKAAGSAALSLSSGSILANDGKGTNILSGLGSASFTITESTGSSVATQPPIDSETSPAGSLSKSTKTPPAPIIYSSTHPDSDSWYSNSSPEFKWKLTPDITGVSVYLDNKPISNPGPISDGSFNKKSYQNLEDGIWYLHLKLKNSYGWGSISHFKIQIDTTAPEPPAIKFAEGKNTYNPRPTLTIIHKDRMSGSQGHCEIKIDNGEWFSSNYETLAELPDQPHIFRLPLQEPGRHTILIKALDNAGNYTVATEEFNIIPLPAPVFTDYPKQIRTDETFALKGTSVANADVAIWMQREKDDARSYAVKSDEKGGFTFTAGEKLKDGISLNYETPFYRINPGNLKSSKFLGFSR